jgi:selenophosphate synthetase-related protein
MDNCYGINKSAVRVNETYHKGQKILYKGEDAHVIEVEPVLTISIDGKYHINCGNISDEVRPS